MRSPRTAPVPTTALPNRSDAAVRPPKARPVPVDAPAAPKARTSRKAAKPAPDPAVKNPETPGAPVPPVAPGSSGGPSPEFSDAFKAAPPAPKTAKTTKAAPKADDPDAPGSTATGSPFVRLISDAGLVRAIPSALVCSKLSEGWQFIVDEPSFPREHCPPALLNTPDRSGEPGFYPRARFHDRPMTEVDAKKVWIAQMSTDRVAFAGRTDLDFKVFDRMLAAALAPPSL